MQYFCTKIRVCRTSWCIRICERYKCIHRYFYKFLQSVWREGKNCCPYFCHWRIKVKENEFFSTKTSKHVFYNVFNVRVIAFIDHKHESASKDIVFVPFQFQLWITLLIQFVLIGALFVQMGKREIKRPTSVESAFHFMAVVFQKGTSIPLIHKQCGKV